MSTPIEKLPLHAAEKGNYPVEVSFYDEKGAKVVPNVDSAKWKLFDHAGTELTIGDLTPALDMVVMLEGDNLAVSGEPDKHEPRGDDTSVPLYYRRLYVEGKVNSDLGNDIPVNKEFCFYIEGMMGA